MKSYRLIGTVACICQTKLSASAKLLQAWHKEGVLRPRPTGKSPVRISLTSWPKARERSGLCRLSAETKPETLTTNAAAMKALLLEATSVPCGAVTVGLGYGCMKTWPIGSIAAAEDVLQTSPFLFTEPKMSSGLADKLVRSRFDDTILLFFCAALCC